MIFVEANEGLSPFFHRGMITLTKPGGYSLFRHALHRAFRKAIGTVLKTGRCMTVSQESDEKVFKGLK